jgi:DNA-binding NtrC family response regulator
VTLTTNPNGRLVLVVDDEPAILALTAVALVRAGLRTILAENGAAGLRAFLVEPNTIDLVLADMIMPGMDGVAMVQEIRKVRPNIPVLFMSANSYKVVTVKEMKFPLIDKPFITDDLVSKVIEILDSHIEEERRTAPIEGRRSKSWFGNIGRE